MKASSRKVAALTTSPSARESPKPLKPSVPAPREPGRLTFKWEQFSRIFREIAPLTFENWAESGLFPDKVKCDPDWRSYFYYEDLGILHILTARADDKLVGYCVCFVEPHRQAQGTPTGTIDTVWLHKDYRPGAHGVRLLKRAFADLEARGVELTLVAAKGEAMGRLLHMLGFTPVETLYGKIK